MTDRPLNPDGTWQVDPRFRKPRTVPAAILDAVMDRRWWERDSASNVGESGARRGQGFPRGANAKPFSSEGVEINTEQPRASGDVFGDTGPNLDEDLGFLEMEPVWEGEDENSEI